MRLTRLQQVMLLLLPILIALLLLTQLHVARFTAGVQSSQATSRADFDGGPDQSEAPLKVYLVGLGSLARYLQEPIEAGLREHEIPFAVVIETDPPAEQSGPVLLIRIDRSRGVWTPFYATRRVEATLVYSQGSTITREAIERVSQGAEEARLYEDCVAPCANGRRRSALKSKAVGLISLPAMRADVAKRLAAEAVALVAGAVPPPLSVDGWSERAISLARERQEWSKGSEGRYFTFQRLADCRGGVVFTTESGSRGDWTLLYYDAERDAISESVTAEEVRARLRERPDLSDIREWDGGGIGTGPIGIEVTVGALPDHRHVVYRIPAGSCGLGGGEVDVW